MDFGAVLSDLRAFLDEKGCRYALVGGLAMAAYGLPRMTLDLYLAVEGSCQDDLVRHVEGAGYGTLHRSSGYSNHVHPEAGRGSVDFVYVRGQTAERLFMAALRHAREHRGSGFTLEQVHLLAVPGWLPRPRRRNTFEGWEPFEV